VRFFPFFKNSSFQAHFLIVKKQWNMENGAIEITSLATRFVNTRMKPILTQIELLNF